MNENEQLSQDLFEKRFDELSVTKKKVIDKIADQEPIAQNVNRTYDAESTLGGRVADRMAAFGGSWTFIIIFFTIITSWITINAVVLVRYDSVFDPYPFILLNLCLSTLAAFQAPIIMMSQNRQAAKDRIEQQANYEVSLKTDLEMMRLHDKIDVLTALLEKNTAVQK